MTDEDIKRLVGRLRLSERCTVGRPTLVGDAADALEALLDEVERLREIAARAVGLGKEQAAEWDRFWRVIDESGDMTVDECIARWSQVCQECDEALNLLERMTAETKRLRAENINLRSSAEAMRRERDEARAECERLREDSNTWVRRCERQMARAERAEKVVAAIPDEVDIFRTIKRSAVLTHVGMAKAVAAMMPITAPAEPAPTGRQVDTWVEPFIAEVRRQQAEGRILDAEAVQSILYDRAEITSDASGPGMAVTPYVLSVRYTNWRGETADRRISACRLWFGTTQWHPEPQWLLKAWDHDKCTERDFALADMVPMPLDVVAEPADTPQTDIVGDGAVEGGSGETKTFARPLEWPGLGGK